MSAAGADHQAPGQDGQTFRRFSTYPRREPTRGQNSHLLRRKSNGRDRRRGRTFLETRPWGLNQLLTADEGLRAVTIEAAYALRDEERRGHLAVGTLGDVTVLSGDVLDGTPDEIRALDVVATIVNGGVAYCSETEICGLDGETPRARAIDLPRGGPQGTRLRRSWCRC